MRSEWCRQTGSSKVDRRAYCQERLAHCGQQHNLLLPAAAVVVVGALDVQQAIRHAEAHIHVAICLPHHGGYTFGTTGIVS